MRSDIQLKENITFIDKSPAGHSIYEWNYKGEPESNRYQGVMAQELLETAPHAVVTMDDGYLGVKYDEIDVDCTITSCRSYLLAYHLSFLSQQAYIRPNRLYRLILFSFDVLVRGT